jgi:hypothetical protein
VDRRAHIEPWKLVPLGVAAGMVGGSLGVGGGIVLVPLLVAAGLRRHEAHATSLSGIVLTAAAGAISFGVAGEVDFALGVTIGLGGIVGSTSGTWLMNRISARSLTVVFAMVLLVAGIRLISGASPVPGSVSISSTAEIFFALGVGVIAGFLGGLAGIGGGVVIVPSLVLLLGLEQHMAQGTSLLAIVFTSSAGTFVNMRYQRVRPMDGLLVGCGGIAGSLIATRIALGVEARTLSLVFGFLVLFVSLRSLYRTFRRPAV